MQNNTLPSFLAPRRAIVKEKRKALAPSLADFAEREDVDFKKLGDEINQVATLHNEIKEFVDRKQKSESDATKVSELRNLILSKAFAFFAPDHVFERNDCSFRFKQIAIKSGSTTSTIEVAQVHESSALFSGKIIDGCIVFESVRLGYSQIIFPVEKTIFLVDMPKMIACIRKDTKVTLEDGKETFKDFKMSDARVAVLE